MVGAKWFGNWSGFLQQFRLRRNKDGSVDTGTPIPVLPHATADYALTLSAFWACCRLISQSIATLPGHVFEETTDGKIKAVDHRLYRMLSKEPNPLMTFPQWVQTTVMNLLIYGNAFSLPYNFEGETLGLFPLDPRGMEIKIDGGRVFYSHTADGKKTTFSSPRDLCHFRVFSLDGLIGLSPLDYQRLTLDISSSSVQYAWGLYKSGGRPNGVLEYPGPLKREQSEQIRADWNDKHGEGKNDIAILSGGTKYNPISIPLDQLEYIAQQKFSVEQIARIFGVPPHLIGAQDKPTYASVEMQSVEFRQYTIQPIVTAIERTIENVLLDPPFIFRFNMSGFERGDIKTRYAAYATARNWGWLSANDIRELEDMNRIGEQGDIYLSPLNMVSAGDAGTLPDAQEEVGQTTP